MVSDESGSRGLYWNDLRITGGKDPLALGSNNSGKGVGGGSVHGASFTPRFYPSDFEIYTRDGVGADWPIDYEYIEPYYQLLEREMPVAGPAIFPWGKPHSHPYGPHPMGEVGNVLIKVAHLSAFLSQPAALSLSFLHPMAAAPTATSIRLVEAGFLVLVIEKTR